MKIARSLAQVAVLCLVLGRACVDAQEPPGGQAPPAAQPAAIAAPRSSNYQLRANDVLAIKVFREPDLDAQRRVSKDGTIDFPLIGTVHVGGCTTTQAASRIAALLDKDYLVHPQVAVDVVTFAKLHYSVMGQVGRPGTFDLPEDGEVDLSQAIVEAGGFTRLADLAHVVVHRQNGDHFEVDCRPLTKNKPAKPTAILPGDTINVGERLL